jgi:hypothetical protein
MSWRRSVLLVAALLGATGCGHYAEIARVPSPDGLVEAVVVEVEAGGGNPFVYQLHLVARGAAWRKGHERLSYTDPIRFRVAWLDARHLELCYDAARILSGEPRSARASQSPPDLVEIRLVTPVAACTSPSPPS